MYRIRYIFIVNYKVLHKDVADKMNGIMIIKIRCGESQYSCIYFYRRNMLTIININSPIPSQDKVFSKGYKIVSGPYCCIFNHQVSPAGYRNPLKAKIGIFNMKIPTMEMYIHAVQVTTINNETLIEVVSK